jgi:hypothetical protein
MWRLGQALTVLDLYLDESAEPLLGGIRLVQRLQKPFESGKA